MVTQVAVTDRIKNWKREILVHETEFPNFEARLATNIIERWALVAAAPAGEDSAGRSVLGLLEERALVAPACNIAEIAGEAFRKRGWFVPAPDVSELIGNLDEK